MMTRYFSALLAALLAISGGGSGVNASDPSGQFSDAGWTLGGIVIVSPKYEGSKSHEVVGFPYIYPDFGGATGKLSIRGSDDVRYQLWQSNGFVAGPLAGYKFDREEGDGERLRGLGDVDGGVVVGAFAGYQLAPGLMLDVSYHRTVTGDVDGGQVRFGLDYEVPVSATITLLGRVGATYADDAYMGSYFGVNALQSANSVYMLPVYNAGAGIKDVHFELGAKVLIDDNWAVRVGGRYGRLMGDAADSPVIETEDQFSGFANITYKLGTLR